MKPRCCVHIYIYIEREGMLPSFRTWYQFLFLEPSHLLSFLEPKPISARNSRTCLRLVFPLDRTLKTRGRSRWLKRGSVSCFGFSSYGYPLRALLASECSLLSRPLRWTRRWTANFRGSSRIILSINKFEHRFMNHCIKKQRNQTSLRWISSIENLDSSTMEKRERETQQCPSSRRKKKESPFNALPLS